MRRAPLTAALLAVLALLVLPLAPGLLSGVRLVGNGTPDTWGHAWGYWWALYSLRHGVFPAGMAPILYPTGETWWVIDLPMALALTPATWLLGAGRALLLAFALHMAAGAAGLCWWLGRAGVGPRLAIAAGVLGATSPFVRGAVTSGIPEALAVLLLPAFAALLEAAAERGGRHLVAAGALGVLLGFDGFYGALLGAFVGVVVAIGALRRHGWSVLGRLAVVATSSGCAIGAHLWLFRVVGKPVIAHRELQLPPAGFVEGWVQNPPGGADVLNFIAPSAFLPSLETPSLHRHTVYVGVVLIAAALWACRSSWRSRGAVALAAIGVVLGLGARLRIAGHAHAILPGAWIMVHGATNLYRLAGLVPLALLAATVPALKPRTGTALLLLVGLDWAFNAPIPIRIPTVANPAGAVETWLAAQPEPGAVLDLPNDSDGQAWPGIAPQRTYFLQTVHHRAVASGFHARNPVLQRDPLLGELMRVGRQSGQRQLKGTGGPPAHLPLPSAGEAEAARRRLREQGFAFVTLDSGQLPEELQGAVASWAHSWLGEPEVEDGQRMGWRLEAE